MVYGQELFADKMSLDIGAGTDFSNYLNKEFMMNTNFLDVKVYESRTSMGEAAAKLFAQEVKGLLTEKSEVNVIFAAAPSQNEFLASLQDQDLDWGRINAFHMDEYIGLDSDEPQCFGKFLKDRLFGRLPFRSVHYINGKAENLEKECKRYSDLITEYPPHIVCMGIGENGHIAFNDPPVADFNDPKKVKVVELDHVCRQQQVNDGCFVSIEQVPTHALTLTIPSLFGASSIYCVVPGHTKAQAVYDTLHREIIEAYPATVLRKHRNTILFLDIHSSVKLNEMEYRG